MPPSFSATGYDLSLLLYHILQYIFPSLQAQINAYVCASLGRLAAVALEVKNSFLFLCIDATDGACATGLVEEDAVFALVRDKQPSSYVV